FVGPAEAFLAASSGFKPINQSMCFAFRKTCVGPMEQLSAHRPRPAVPVKSPHGRHAHHTNKARIAPVPSPSASVSAAIDLAHARQLGDVGEFLEAVKPWSAHTKQ